LDLDNKKVRTKRTFRCLAKRTLFEPALDALLDKDFGGYFFYREMGRVDVVDVLATE
jgi:hypothetical protein